MMQLGRPTGGIGLQAKIDAMKEVGRKPHALPCQNEAISLKLPLDSFRYKLY